MSDKRRVTQKARGGALASRDGFAFVVGFLMGSGAMCPKCCFGTRATSKNWARCKKCGERVRRAPHGKPLLGTLTEGSPEVKK